jgi:hypothetical protein
VSKDKPEAKNIVTVPPAPQNIFNVPPAEEWGHQA